VDLTELTLAKIGKIENPKSKIRLRRFPVPSVAALPHQCDRIWRGVRTATRKLVLNEHGSPWLFFELSTIPLERMNLVGDPARAAEIAALRAQVG